MPTHRDVFPDRQRDAGPPPADSRRLSIVNCPFCTFETEPRAHSMALQLLKLHVASCPGHPMRQVEAAAHRLRAALERLLGGETRAELKQARKALGTRTVIAFARERVEAAIEVLLATLPEDADE